MNDDDIGKLNIHFFKTLFNNGRMKIHFEAK